MWGLPRPPPPLPALGAGLRGSTPSPACPGWRPAAAIPAGDLIPQPHLYIDFLNRVPLTWSFAQGSGAVGPDTGTWERVGTGGRHLPHPRLATSQQVRGSEFTFILQVRNTEAPKLPESSTGMLCWSVVAGHTSVAASSKAAVFPRK